MNSTPDFDSARPVMSRELCGIVRRVRAGQSDAENAIELLRWLDRQASRLRTTLRKLAIELPASVERRPSLPSRRRLTKEARLRIAALERDCRRLSEWAEKHNRKR